MKKITLLFCAALFSAGMTAQVVTEDFEGGVPAGWSSTVNTGTCDAVVADFTFATGPSHGSASYYFDDDACGNGADASNVTITSDSYDVSGSTGTVTIGYDVIFQEVALGETFTTEVFTGSTWELVTTYDTDLADVLTESFSGPGTNPDFAVRWTYDDAGGAWGWHGSVDNFSLDFTLSTDDNQIAGFSMFPNPAIDIVTVKAQNEIQNVSFYNILGQKVLEVAPNALSQEINVATLKAGVYIVNVVSDEQQGSYRLIKQ